MGDGGRRRLPSLREMASLVVGAAALSALSAAVGIGRVTARVANADPMFFLAAVACHLAAASLTGARLAHLIGGGVTLRSIIFPHLAGYLAGAVTPAKAGYLVVIPLAEGAGARREEVTGAVFSAQAVDFAVRSGILTAAALYLGLSGRTTTSAVAGAALSLALSAGLASVASERVRGLLRRITLGRPRSAWEWIDETGKTMGRLGKALPLAVVLTIASWILTSARWFFAAEAVGASASPEVFLLLHPLVYTFAFVPVSAAGLGLVEAAGVGLLVELGVPPDAAMGSLLLDRAAELVGSSLGVGTLVRGGDG